MEKLEKNSSISKEDNNNINEGEENLEDNPLEKLKELKEKMLLFDKEIVENKEVTNDLINEYKNLINISENNKDEKDLNDDYDENDKKELLLLKEKNNKLTNELTKLKDVTQNLKESKNKIIEIYEDEINKLNGFYLKAKEKTEINSEKKADNNELSEEKLIKIIKENEKIKKENFDFIKDLDKLAELQQVYQELIEENKNLKTEINNNNLGKENQKKLEDIIKSEENYNMNEEENVDKNN